MVDLKQFPGTKGNILWEMKELATVNQALDLTVGLSDFKCPEPLSELASSYIKKGYNNFSPTEGLLPLRKQISAMVKGSDGYHYNPETEINITGGTIQTISSIIGTFIREDDEVIIIEPSYITYSPAVKLAGGRPVYVALKYPDFHIDWEEVRKLVSGKTRMIILNTPHNPTGRVFTSDDLLQLQRLIIGTNIIVLSDEMFEQLVFDNKKHQSVSKFEKLVHRSFIVSSFGPVFNINGWCLSWCMAPELLMSEFRKTYMNQAFYANTPLQYALSDYLETGIDFSEINDLYQGKRNYFIRLMVDSPFKIIPTQGTYFQLIDFSDISGMNDLDFAYNLLVHAKVATIPLSAFYKQKSNSKQLRICFAKNNETLEMAAERISKVAEIFRQ
jgi:methionine transaminase